MELTSEQVHWAFGAVLIAAGSVMAIRDLGKIGGRWVNYLMPALFLVFGVEMLLDPLVHGAAAPGDYAAEAAQHFSLGLLLIATSVLEFIRVRRAGEGLIWQFPLAAALLVAAATFWFHAQHDSEVPMTFLVTQHRMIAATLMVAAVAALTRSTGQDESRQIAALSLLTLLLGLQFLIYTEGGSVFGGSLGGPDGAHGAG